MNRLLDPSTAPGRKVRLALLGGIVAGCLGALIDGWLWGTHIAFEGVAFGCFVAILALEGLRRWLTVPAVLAVAGLLFALALSFPPRESADVWSYAMYGRIVASGDDPYRTAPVAFPDDPWLRLVSRAWRDTPSLYGPLFNETAAEAVRLSRGSALRVRVEFQFLAVLGVGGAMLLLARRSAPPGALALLGLNPLVVLGVVNAGHNDALVGLAVLGAVLLAEDERSALSGVCVGLGALIKVVALLPAGILVLWTWRRRSWREALLAGGAVVETVAAGYLIAGSGAVRALGGETGLVTPFSVWRLTWLGRPDIATGAGRILHVLAPGRLGSAIPVALVLILALAAALPWLRLPSPARAVGVSALLYLVAAPYAVPWYLFWTLPVLAAAWRCRLTWLALGYQAALTIAYSLALRRPLGTVASTARVSYFGALVVAEVLAILALLALPLVRARRWEALMARVAAFRDGRAGPTDASWPGPSGTGRTGFEPPPGWPAARPRRPAGDGGSR